MYEYEILCGISKGTFEIPHKISYAYIQRCGFDLRAHKCFWNAPQDPILKMSSHA